MGVVYYSNYFVWFEVARTDLFRKRGYPYKVIEERLGLRLVVVGAECRYIKPARYDDFLKINCSLVKIGNSSIEFLYEIKKKNVLVAEGKSTHVFTDCDGKPKRIPVKLKEAFNT